MRSLRLLAAPSLLALTLAGCTTTLTIHSMQPGAVSVGPTNHISIMDGEGRRSAREFVFMEIANQSRSRGWFSVDDRSEEGLQVEVAGRRVTVEGLGSVLEDRQAGLRVDILEWTSFRSQEDEQVTDAQGNAIVKQVPVQIGQVLLSVTMFDASGKTYLAETEYDGHCATRDMQMPRDVVIEVAARDAVSRYLDDVTPSRVASRVELDDEDPFQESILETARAGSVALAARDMRAYLEQHPESPSAAYNLAVFLEAMGEYAEALETYDRAITLGGKAFYIQARAGCARRLAAARELAED